MSSEKSNLLHTASPVAQVNQRRVPVLCRGSGPISQLQSQPNRTKTFKILQCNINGLSTAATRVKLDQILDMAVSHDVQIIALQETKLSKHSHLKIKGYHTFRCDRPNGRGGGLALLIRDVNYRHIDISFLNSDLEMQGILVNWNNRMLKIFNFYQPPNQSCLPDSLLEHEPDNCPSIFLGDLNAKHTLWGCSDNNNRGIDLLNVVDDSSHMFLNDGSHTHFSFSYNTAEALDISFVSAEIYPLCRWAVLNSVGSDHLPILIELFDNHKTPIVTESFWNFSKAKWDTFTELTEKNFDDVCFGDDLEVNWNRFKNTVIYAAKQTIPRGNYKKPKLIYSLNSPDIAALIEKRNLLFREIRDSGNDDQRIELNKINAAIKRVYADYKRKTWRDMCGKIDARTPNSRLWKLARTLDGNEPQSVRSNTLMDGVGRVPLNDREAADRLGDYYRQVSKLAFNESDKQTERCARNRVHRCRSSILGDSIFNENFAIHELDNVLIDLDPKKSPGPDNIHCQMILHLGSIGRLRFLYIINQSWKKGRIPLDWKRANIIPIKKLDGEVCSPESYRPISLTSVPCKIMEKMLLNRINFYLSSNDLLPREQYGFRRGHSTIDQILFFCQSVRDAHNMKPTNHTVAAFLDLSKAFDRVWRNKLIVKLFDDFGIRGRALPWISDFLRARIFRVKFNKTLSRDFRINQGVPQGSVLGPILFCLFFTGIERVISKRCNVGIFADDVVLWSSGPVVENIENNVNLTLREVSDFAQEHKLIFNTSKSVTSFYTTNRHIYNYQPVILLNGQILPYVKNARYLGFILDQEILCNKHIISLEERCRKRLNLLKYISGRDWGADAATLKLTYSSLIRPILEYGHPIYSCASESNLKILDKVQISAAKIITGLRRSCPDKIVLYESDLQPLNLRRIPGLVKYYSKLISYGDQNRTSSYLKNWNGIYRLKRNSPFSFATSNGIIELQALNRVEPHLLRPCLSPNIGLQRVHFHTELVCPVQKKIDNPELLRQLALETIDQIPSDALQIYTDGSKGEGGLSGSGVYIKSTTSTLNLGIRNSDLCSVFRSELIAIESGLSHVVNITAPAFKSLWILSDSKSAIQHISNWMKVGDRASTSILEKIHGLSSYLEIHFQWIPSHIGISGNEIADTLAKSASLEPSRPDMPSTFDEIFSTSKMRCMDLWKVPPSHHWYFRNKPGGALIFEGLRADQTCLSRFASGHLRCLSYVQGVKCFGLCTKCRVTQAAPEHILDCMDFKRDEVFSKPQLFLDFLRVYGLMELV